MNFAKQLICWVTGAELTLQYLLPPLKAILIHVPCNVSDMKDT